MPYDPNNPRNQYAPKPGSPEYEQWLANRNGKSLSPNDNINEPTRPQPTQPAGKDYTPGWNFTGEGTGTRSDAYGDRAGAGDGSKFQADFHKTNRDIQGMLMGGRDPNQIGIDPRTGNYHGQMQDFGQNQTRGMQMQLMQQLQDQAAGNGPSLAQMQLQKGTDQNISQAMALGASQRGAGQAGMMKGIAQQQAQIGQGMANDSAMLRLQEQMQARQMLGSGLQGMRGGDQAQSGMQLQNQQFGATQQMEAERLRQETQLAYEKMRQQAAKDNSIGGMIGGAMGAIGSM